MSGIPKANSLRRMGAAVELYNRAYDAALTQMGKTRESAKFDGNARWQADAAASEKVRAAFPPVGRPA